MTAMIIIRNNLIPFPGYKAITIWPFIFVRRNAWYSNDTDRHERDEQYIQHRRLYALAALCVQGLTFVVVTI